MEVAASGRHSHGQFPRNAELLDEPRERLAEIVERRLLGVTLPMSADAWTKLGMRAPHPVLVALNDDRHRNRDSARACHFTTITRVQRGSREVSGQAVPAAVHPRVSVPCV